MTTALDDRVFPSGHAVNLTAGEVLFTEGDEADAAYLLLSGRCALSRGDEHIDVIDAGEFVGEISLFGGTSRTGTVRADTDATLLRMSREALTDALTSSDELLWMLLRTIVTRSKHNALREVRYRSEHEALRAQQESMLPDLSALPTGAGFRATGRWEPSTFASGDLYEVVRVDERRWLFAIGDVMGHGAQASLTMAIARAQIRELAHTSRRTDELLLRLDGYMRDNAPPRQAMTLFVAMYDHSDRSLEYSSAGHPYPLFSRDHHVERLVGRPGVLVGLPMVAGDGYHRGTKLIATGDRLLMVTDGLFEVPTTNGQQLGIDGLAAHFAEVLATDSPTTLDDLYERLRAELERTGESADNDDRTALLISFE
ncbi:MAG: SpoIIE family protein phosphatase [Actinomycetota bacterium]